MSPEGPDGYQDQDVPLGLGELTQRRTSSVSGSSQSLFISCDFGRPDEPAEQQALKVDPDAVTLDASSGTSTFQDEPYSVIPFSPDIDHTKPTRRDFAVFRFIWVQYLQQFRDEFLAGVEQSGKHTRNSANPETSRLEYYDALQRRTFRHLDNFLDHIPPGLIRAAASRYREVIERVFTSFKNHRTDGRKEAKDLLDELIEMIKPHDIFDLETLERVGAGAFGVVYSIVLRATGERVALKIVKPKNHAAYSRLQQEVFRLLETTHEERVVSAYGAFYTPKDVPGIPGSKGHIVIVSEYFEGRSLSEFIQEMEGMPPEERLRMAAGIISQVAEALVGLHRLGITHRDLKPDNIIICPDGTVRIVDLGLSDVRVKEVKTELPTLAARRPHFEEPEGALSSSSLDPRSTCDTKVDTQGAIGTPLYFSPENLDGSHFVEASDAWALWLMFWQMATGKTLYEDFDKTPLLSFLTGIRNGETTMKTLMMKEDHQKHLLQFPAIIRNALVKGFSQLPEDRLSPSEMAGILRVWRIVQEEDSPARRFLLADYCRSRVSIGAIHAPEGFEAGFQRNSLPSLLGGIEKHVFSKREEMKRSGNLQDYLTLVKVLDDVAEASFLEFRQAS